MAEAPNQEEQEIAIITLESEDGHSYDCEMLDRFVFEDNEYALLLKIAEEGADEELEEEEAADEDVDDDEEERAAMTLVAMR